MIVLSVFDGMSCGQIALKKSGVKINKYYASEIDKFAIQQTQHNFPDTIQLGNIVGIKAKDLLRIDLVIGGSPCQGFSFAGKQLNFNDPRSALFFEFVRLWKEVKTINPDAKFLLENVNMKKEYLRIISEYMEVFPVRINSNLVSAQNRDRWYWTNIRTKETGLFSELWSDIPQPKDEGILLKDILQPESEVDEKYYIKNSSKYDTKGLNLEGKAKTQRSSTGWSLDEKHNYQIIGVLNANGELKSTDKSNCIDANYHKGIENHQQRTAVYVKKNLIQIGYIGNVNSIGNRVYSMESNKSRTLTDGGGGGAKAGIWQDKNYRLRRLTPTECARLQTIPEQYKWVVSDTQIYKMLGNGWTVKVIEHIFSFL